MPRRINYEPALAARPGEPFLQTIRLGDGREPIGVARWHAAAPTDGAAQILEFTILPPHRRQGHGRALLRAIIEQFKSYTKLHQTTPRRLWISIAQKDQVIARAFLISEGFTHIVSVAELLRGQDALIYVRTFD